MTRDELYKEALQTIAKRRQKAEVLAQAKRAHLYAILPKLKELDAEKNTAGAAAAMLSAQGNNTKANEELAKAHNIEAQRQALIASANFKEEDFKPHYSCKICGDTGRHGGEACQCVRNEMAMLRRKEINRLGRFNLSSFDSFKLDKYPETMLEGGELLRPRVNMQAILDACKGWATDFGPHSESLYMFGGAGLGKTHLALAMAAQVLNAGHDVIYVSSQAAFGAIAAHNEESDELFAGMLNADLLVLDDLGTEYINAYIAGKLYQLVNGRMGRRPTIYTTNICSKKLLDARYDEKITSRLLGECQLMRFWGEDIRLNNKRGK